MRTAVHYSINLIRPLEERRRDASAERPSGLEKTGAHYVGRFQYLPGPQGLPLFKPPWGRLVAIDMSRGEHRWRAPVGSGDLAAIRHLKIPDRLGWPNRSFVLVTKSVLLVVQAGVQSNARPAPFSPRRRVLDINDREPKLYAYDKASGRLLAEVPLPANGERRAHDLPGGRQAVRGVPGRRLEPHRGADRAHAAVTRGT